MFSCVMGRANRGKWSTWMRRVGSGKWLSETLRWSPSPVLIKDCVILVPVGKFRIVLTACQIFMGPDKPSSLVTILSNHTSLLQGGFMEGERVSIGWQPGWTIAGNQNLILGAGVRFRHSRDIAEGCCIWSPRDCVCNVLSCFPYRVYTDLNRRDTLGYEWPLAHCCQLVVFIWWLMVGLVDYYYIFRMMLTTLLMYLFIAWPSL
jgi:hypothetical protein